ncbi:MAG: AbrB/MazE/SpoVT family DNA-binding domain-containing protein [Candidatus Binatia bacterium]
MRLVTTMTSKGQVTIPKAIRDEVGLKHRDRIEFTLENGSARLRRARLSLAEITGMLPPMGVPVEEMPALAWDEWVERYLEEDD